jgi:L,D-peptidoglycan transpeptidase YkuD (ErfK/YbiS/YcfS/YnhG family)
MTFKAPLIVLASFAVLVGVAAAGPAHAAVGDKAARAEAAALSSTATVRQLITVSASSYTTTYATVRVYSVSGTKRTLVYGPWQARVGYNGVAKPGMKREGDGKTPSGTYGFSFFFGVDKNPGVSFPYRVPTINDVWDDDPRSPHYNEWVDAHDVSPGWDPERLRNPPAYDYAAVIAYNTARTPGLGSAVFLHVGTGGDTAGCVSLPVSELLKVLRLLKPADNPRITITG